MILEASQVITAPVVSAKEENLAVVDQIIFDGAEAKIAGFQVKPRGILTKLAALDYANVLTCNRQEVVVDKANFSRDLKHFEALADRYGRVINVVAKTESGDKIGRVTDLIFDVETGLISRFYLRSIFHERIIPRQYLVAITPKAVVFKDIVNEPLFDELATAPASA